jgi:Chaperone of endosialidase
LNSTGSQNTAVGYQALYNNNNPPDTANTAVGYQALYSNTSGLGNVAIGKQSLYSNILGNRNTAIGPLTLSSNIGDGNDQGILNTAVGNNTLTSNTKGSRNTATGGFALGSNTEGNNNTACGRSALASNTMGSSNIGLGFGAGQNLTIGSNNIDIGNNGVADETNTMRIGTQGTQVATFIAGIYGATTSDAASTVQVYVDMNGNLGTTASSERFKKDIGPMDKVSEAVLALKPVKFHYKDDIKGIPQFGLVAEEVAKVNPDLVVLDAKGQIYTVRYDAVNAMLLNEFLKEHCKVQELEKKIEALTAGLQKVSAQIEVVKPAPQVVNNDQ